MSVTFTKDKESKNLFVVQIKGTFTFEDLKEIQNKAHAEIDRSQKVKLLILNSFPAGAKTVTGAI
jgi:MFS superfamily sulfate permease-like transporter